MSGAREVLLSGPNEVDIVIARGTDPASPKSRTSPAPKHTMPESSVDYENVIVLPQERTDAKRSVFLSQLLTDENTDPGRNLQPSTVGLNTPSSEKLVRKRHYKKNSNSINHKLLRKAIASYSGSRINVDKESVGEFVTGETGSDSSDKFEVDSTANFCTLPRRPRSTMCTFHTFIYEKGWCGV